MINIGRINNIYDNIKYKNDIEKGMEEEERLENIKQVNRNGGIKKELEEQEKKDKENKNFEKLLKNSNTNSFDSNGKMIFKFTYRSLPWFKI